MASYYLNQWCLSLLMHSQGSNNGFIIIHGFKEFEITPFLMHRSTTRPQWVKMNYIMNNLASLSGLTPICQKDSFCRAWPISDQNSPGSFSQCVRELIIEILQKKYFCLNHDSNYQIRSQFCTCHERHGSSAVVTCAKLLTWPNHYTLCSYTFFQDLN